MDIHLPHFPKAWPTTVLSLAFIVILSSLAYADDSGRNRVGTELPEGYRGVWTTWHENGSKAFEGSYHQGVRHGSWRHWYPNGQIQLEGTYNEGLSNGKFGWWHANGLRSVEANYQNARPHGKRTEWDKTGDIIAGTHYVDGKITVLERYEEGRLVGKEPAPTHEEHAQSCG